MRSTKLLQVLFVAALIFSAAVYADEDDAEETTETSTETTTSTDTGSTEATKEEEGASDGFNAEQWKTLKDSAEVHQFQAEVSRLMDIIINSLYSNRDIFLRELISNASDALDKIRYLSLKDKKALGDKPDLDIRIKFDKKARTLTITDSGVGMSKEELKKHLGVVASTGTTKFLEAAKAGSGDTLSLIGQFGVGFYSVYLVADRVTVISKSNDDDQHVWESTAKQTFTVSADPRGNTLGRGTEIVLHLKEDASEYLDQAKLRGLVEKYSQFINFPIYLWETKTVTEEVPVEDEKPADEDKKEDEDKKDDEEVESKDEDADKEKKPKTKKVDKTVSDWEQVNENKAIWTRKPKDIAKEEYEAFYKTIAKDKEPPLSWTHFNAEGELSFKSILFIPKEAAFDLYDKYYSKSNALKLYVRRVLISEEFEDFMPRYLSFVKGVVDSDDLPLNVSRETLSKSKVLKVMAKKLVLKVLEMLRKLAEENAPKKKKKEDKKDDDEDKEDDEEEDKKEEEEEDKEKEEDKEDKDKPDRYQDFWKQYGKSIKLGCIEDTKNKAKLTKLLRFRSMKSGEKFISLQSYIDGMKEKQEHIYYITGENVDQVKNSPFLEKLKKRDYDVLYLVDPLDEYLMSHVTEYDGKKFQSVSKEGLKFGDEDEAAMKKKEKAVSKMYDKLTSWLKALYGERVEKVVVSNRIENSPCVLVTSQWGWSANMERIMKAQAFGDVEKQKYMMSKKTLEINPRHPIIMELKKKTEETPDDQGLKDLANIMFDAAVLNSGFAMDNTESFASRINRVVTSGLSVPADAKVVPEDEFEVPVEEEEPPKSSDSESEAEPVQPADDTDSSEATRDDAESSSADASDDSDKDEL